jgi:hypothetical protein
MCYSSEQIEAATYDRVNESWTFQRSPEAPTDRDVSHNRPRTPEEQDMSNLKQKIRAHREHRQFERALRTASPSMHHELMALAAHQNYNR